MDHFHVRTVAFRDLDRPDIRHGGGIGARDKSIRPKHPLIFKHEGDHLRHPVFRLAHIIGKRDLQIFLRDLFLEILMYDRQDLFIGIVLLGRPEFGGHHDKKVFRSHGLEIRTQIDRHVDPDRSFVPTLFHLFLIYAVDHVGDQKVVQADGKLMRQFFQLRQLKVDMHDPELSFFEPLAADRGCQDNAVCRALFLFCIIL